LRPRQNKSVMETNQNQCEGCQRGLNLLAGSHWENGKAVMTCRKDEPTEHDEPKYTFKDLQAAAQIGEDWQAANAYTIGYLDIKELLEEKFLTK
jgi:hypothetical protein